MVTKERNIIFIWMLLHISIITHPSYAQNYTLSGIIKEKKTGETLPGVSLRCDSLKTYIQSNNYGFYSISLPAGNHKITVSTLGFTAIDTIVSMSQNIRLDFFLAQGITLKEVVISAEEKRKISEESQMSVINIPIQQIKDVPALFGEKDVLKVIQLMPGIQKGSEGNSGIYVRGGGPDQNLIILDDATVYNAYHLFGFFSLFNGDALKSVELIKGGFPASYGGRLSSVINMQMKEGNLEEYKADIGIGLIASRLMVEGPLKKQKSSFLVSARRTYIDMLVYPLLPSDQKAGYYFYDMNAKLNYVLGDKDRLYASGYFGKDKFYFSNKNSSNNFSGNLNWGNATGTLRWNHIYNGKLFSNTSLIFTNYQLGIGSKEKWGGNFFEMKFSSAIQDYTFKHDFDFFPNNHHHIKAGVLAISHRFRPSAIVAKSSDISQNTYKINTLYSLETGAYVEDDWKMSGRIRTNLGFRLSHYLFKNKSFLNPEPRVSTNVSITPTSSVKASYSLMNQYLHLVSSTGISLPTDLWIPATNNIKPMQSQQWALGWAQELPQGMNLTIESYYKKMKDISYYKEGASFLLIDEPNSTEAVNWERNITQGKGWSYGGEILLQKERGKWNGWIGYTLSWTYVQFDSINFGKKFFPRYDRRHDISIVNIYRINDHIKLSCTWVYGTGNAITLPLGEYNATPHNPAVIDGYNNEYYTGGYLDFREDYGEKNSFRMAAYHRMDIGIQFEKKEKKYTRIFELSVYNVYNRWNPFFYYIDSDILGNSKLMQISLFPILPSVSWTWQF